METRKSSDAMVWTVLRRAADGVCDGGEEAGDWDAARPAKSNIAIHCRDGISVGLRNEKMKNEKALLIHRCDHEPSKEDDTKEREREVRGGDGGGEEGRGGGESERGGEKETEIEEKQK